MRGRGGGKLVVGQKPDHVRPDRSEKGFGFYPKVNGHLPKDLEQGNNYNQIWVFVLFCFT